MAPVIQVRTKTTSVERRLPTLWQQLDPPMRRQLTQQWASMIRKMRQMSQEKEGNNDTGELVSGKD